jgi:hypothetical protein
MGSGHKEVTQASVAPWLKVYLKLLHSEGKTRQHEKLHF